MNICLFLKRFFAMLDYQILPIVYGVHDHYDKIAPTQFLHQRGEIWKYETTGRLSDFTWQERHALQRILLVETAFWSAVHTKRQKQKHVPSMRRSQQHDTTNENLSRYERLVGKSIQLCVFTTNILIFVKHWSHDYSIVLFNSIIFLSKININFFSSKIVFWAGNHNI